MAIDAASVGAKSGPQEVSWTDRDTLLYALGVGAGPDELSFTTENSHGMPQQVLPTFAVVAIPATKALKRAGRINWATVLHGAQEVRVHRPLPAAGTLSVESEVTDLQDKGPGKHAIVELTGRGHDVGTGELVAESVVTLVLRRQGGFGGGPGRRAEPVAIPDSPPDLTVREQTDRRMPLVYRLSGDRNPLHSDPWFAREKAGFPDTIMHGLCTYGIAGRALVHGIADGDASRVTSVAARFSSPVFPGDVLVTEVWRTEDGAVFRTSASKPDGSESRVVLDGGRATLRG